MPEALELPSLTAAAARAASTDDIPAAAALLRQAVELQISTLGPDHPDLATTLNNLALMLERLGHVKEAGQCYRRAHAIAAAALGPDDPVVQVSRANLDAFRATYGQPNGDEGSTPVDPSVWGELEDFPAATDEPVPPRREEPEVGAVPVSVPVTGTVPVSVLELTGEPGPTPTSAAIPEPEPEPELALEFAPVPLHVPDPHPAERYAASVARKPRPPALAIAVIAVVLAGAAALLWNRAGEPAASGTAAPTPAGPVDSPTASAPSPTPSPDAAPAAAGPPPAVTAPPGASGTAGRAVTPPAPTDARPPTAAAADPVPGKATTPPTAAPARAVAAGAPGIADARLCATLSRSRNPWECAPPGNPVRSDAVYYYTRVRSTRDAVIRHRWTRDGQVVQNVRLPIRANATDGFRTFSRQTVSGLGAGTWVVSLLGPDGAVLDEQRFEVK